MADSPNFSYEDWLTTQRKYWDAWGDLARKSWSAAPAAEQASTNPWTMGLDQWWRAVSPAAPADTHEFYDRLLGLGKAYFAIAQGLLGGKEPGNIAGSLNEWLEQTSKAFNRMAGGMGLSGDKSARDFMAFWDLPLDTWQRTLSSLSPLPGDAFHATHTEGLSALAGDVREHMDRFLSIPAVGYTRESQEQHQRLAKLLLDYQKAVQEYNLAFAKVGTSSIERFQDKVAEVTQRDGPIGSIRDLYNLWVDACEEIYGDYVVTDEYVDLYGNMVNALMAVKHHGAQLVDEGLEAMNMPTRREISTLQKRQHELRRESTQLRAQMAEMADLLRTLASTRPAPAPTTKKPKASASSKKEAK